MFEPEVAGEEFLADSTIPTQVQFLFSQASHQSQLINRIRERLPGHVLNLLALGGGEMATTMEAKEFSALAH